jgi:hypothetical protein
MKVKVYFNLHKRCFSVVALEGENKGRVIAHETEVKLINATFKVSEAGRQRVIREQRKNVHACVVGTLTDTVKNCDQAVTYNPYKYNSFVFKKDESPVLTAQNVLLINKQIFIN